MLPMLNLLCFPYHIKYTFYNMFSYILDCLVIMIMNYIAKTGPPWLNIALYTQHEYWVILLFSLVNIVVNLPTYVIIIRHYLNPDIQFYNEISTMYIDNSNYYFEDQSKQMLSESMTGNCLSIIHSNVRSLPAHQIEFESLLDYLCYNFSVIGLTETWLTTSNVSMYNFEGYRHIYNIRSGRAGGGVSLFIKSYIPFSERHDLNLLNEISETVFIQINKNVFGTPKDIIIGIIYRPPNTDPVVFN